jgi:hypothetical protein
MRGVVKVGKVFQHLVVIVKRQRPIHTRMTFQRMFELLRL